MLQHIVLILHGSSYKYPGEIASPTDRQVPTKITTFAVNIII